MILEDSHPPPEPAHSLDRRLRELEQQAEMALPGSEARFFNRAGDLCVQAGAGERAPAYYGEAIDAYLRAGHYNAAGAVCRKLLRVSPASVRARCTLAWLALGKGLPTESRWEVEAYVSAAVSRGQGELARKQIRMMAEATHVPELRSLLAEHLDRLGDDAGAREVLESDAGPPAAREEAEALWARVLRAALMGPEDLRDGR